MIKLHDVHKYYRTGEQSLHVLKGIDLHIREGELVSIMGSSGSGKSTLLNILGVLDSYDSGSYELAGQLVRNLGETEAARLRNRTLGFVFQSFNLLPFKNAAENVALPLYYQGVGRKERNYRAEEFLDMVGPVRPQDLHAQPVVGRAEAARRHRARARRQAQGDPHRRTHGRARQHHDAGNHGAAQGHPSARQHDDHRDPRTGRREQTQRQIILKDGLVTSSHDAVRRGLTCSTACRKSSSRCGRTSCARC